MPIKDCTTMLCPYTAKSLQPFTKYKICITAKDDDRFCEPTWNEPTCIEHSTLEDGKFYKVGHIQTCRFHYSLNYSVLEGAYVACCF